MAETVRRLKINRRYASSACPWCGDTLMLGEDGAVCEACETPHHARCWDEHNGCNGDPACVNRPLQQIPDALQPAEEKRRPLGPGESACPSCGDVVLGYCYRCNEAGVEGQPYTGVRQTADEAKEALKYALIGLICFGFILGPIAIVKGQQAKNLIARSPHLEGAGIATLAQVIGTLELLFFVLYICGNLSRV